MIPNEILRNPYYFVEEDTNGSQCLYNVSTQQDKDGCGKHYVTFFTESAAIERGRQYRNVNGDLVTAIYAGTYDVSTGVIDEAESSKIFPYIKITYSETPIDDIDNIGEIEVVDKYLWLDDMIVPGDLFVDGKFEIMPKHRPDNGGSYVSAYRQQLIQSIALMMEEFEDFEDIKSRMPEYLFAKPGEVIEVDSKYVYLVSVKTSESTDFDSISNDMYFDDDMFLDAYILYCNRLGIRYINTLLAKYNLEIDENTTIILPEMLRQIELTYKLTLPRGSYTINGESNSTATANRIAVQPVVVDVSGVDNINYIPNGREITLNVTQVHSGKKANVFVNNIKIDQNPFKFNIHEDTNVTYKLSDAEVVVDPSIIEPGTAEAVTDYFQTDTKYSVELGTFTNGTVTADKTDNVSLGETVTLVTRPSSGYKLSGLTVSGTGNKSGETVKVKANGGSATQSMSIYTFAMPRFDVKVTAIFTKKTGGMATGGVTGGTTDGPGEMDSNTGGGGGTSGNNSGDGGSSTPTGDPVNPGDINADGGNTGGAQPVGGDSNFGGN